jgi:hypothetical protein
VKLTTTTKTTITHALALDEPEQFDVHKRYGQQSFRAHTIRVELTSEVGDEARDSVDVRVSAIGRRILKTGETNQQVLSEGWYPTMYQNDMGLPAELTALLDQAGIVVPGAVPQ